MMDFALLYPSRYRLFTVHIGLEDSRNPTHSLMILAMNNQNVGLRYR
jgi:hypothetical protein